MVSVKFFAQLREVTGTEGVQVNALDLDGVFIELAKLYPEEVIAQLRGDNVRVAINQELVNGNPALTAGDEVALLPPVTGG
ncbi:MAG TPA: molybdopterin synthase sulfur carrier subunit [Gammaproteobacteria bacterium]|jgi:molybdopterin converting factor subunit 1|nr:molybdopterin synthase sulfur carrier subunit [Gammaproteobacteria bacterium]HBK12854.1 molybdopterin synthase sulfur carrier subunit [Gammaproteobacteria bacterium]